MSMFEITIDVTNICSFDCPFCSTDKESPAMQMSNNVANACLHFIKKIKKLNSCTLIVVISGGEPLLCEKLTQFVELLNSAADKITICTSGSIDKGQEFWEKLHDYGLRTVRLSLHSVMPNICGNIFGQRYSISVVQSTITYIEKASIELELNFVINRKTVESLQDIFDFSAKNGVQKVRLLGLAKQGKAKLNWEQLKISKERENETIKKALYLSSLHNIDVEFAGLAGEHWCSHTDEDGSCLGGKRFFQITCNGDIYPCPGVKTLPMFRIGTVTKDGQFKKIFSNSKKCFVLNKKER